MAVVRDLDNSDTYLTYLSTIALFCGISCTIVMMRFKASLNLSSGKGNGKHYEVPPQASVVGAYRTSREEYFGNINYFEARKTITPSMVKLPPSMHTTQNTQTGNVQTSKSTGDLTKLQVPAEVRKSTPNINVQNAPPGSKEAKNQLKAQKKLDKERIIEQKKRDKLAAQEREKEEKLRKKREKQAAQEQAKEAKEREKQRNKKGNAPRPQQQTTAPQAPQQTTFQQVAVQETTSQQETSKTHANPQGEQKTPHKREAPQPPQFQKVPQRNQPNANPLSHTPVENSRNSLEGSISRNSGPPPYSDFPEIMPNNSDGTGNTSFIKPAETSSWDFISQHRQQMSRTTAANIPHPKQKSMDLRYNVGNLTNYDKDNSEV